MKIRTKIGIFIALISVILLIFIASHSAASQASTWTKVGETRVLAISGISTEAENQLIVVNDNKLPGEPRIGRVTQKKENVTFQTLPWPANAEIPIDLEAISEVPDRFGEFIAVASAGKCFHIKVSGDTVTLLSTFPIPGAKPFLWNNYEGFRLQKIQGEIVAVWTHRGGFGREGLVFVAPFSLSNNNFGPANVYKLNVPWPESDRRDSSDVAISAQGEVFVSATSDPGDDGPFLSTIYKIGILKKDISGLWILPNSNKRFLIPIEIEEQRNSHKIEGLTFLGKTLIAGSDDENKGGWLK